MLTFSWEILCFWHPLEVIDVSRRRRAAQLAVTSSVTGLVCVLEPGDLKPLDRNRSPAEFTNVMLK